MTLSQLFASYGWQLAIVGLLGTIVVGLLKGPIRALVNKISAKDITKTETNFDTVAFLFGFIVAALLGSAYTLVAPALGFISTEGEEALTVDFALFLSNAIGVWLYQITYYQIWKKLGFKRLVSLIVSKVAALFDTNKDGKIDFLEASKLVKGLLRNGKLNIAEVVSVAAKASPKAAKQAILAIEEEAGTAAAVDASANIDKLGAIADRIVSNIPEKKLAKVASALTNAAADAAKDSANSAAQRQTMKF